MRKLLIVLLILCACACNGQALKISSGGAVKFSDPMIDTTQLPDASSAILLHFENNLEDLGGATWVNPALTGWTGFSDAHPKFGSYSLKHDSSYSSTSNYWYSITIPATFTIGTGDYTLEFWLGTEFKNSTGPGANQLFSIVVTSMGGINSFFGIDMALFGGSYYPQIWHDDTYVTRISGDSSLMPAGFSWYHVAFVRSSGTIKGYIDGQEIISRACATDIGAISSLGVYAFNDVTRQTEMQIDELHLCYGAKYTAEFTPPSKPFGAKKPMNIKF